MSIDEGHGEFELPKPSSQAAWSPQGVAYLPGHVLVRGEAAAKHVDVITNTTNAPDDDALGPRGDAADAEWRRVRLAVRDGEGPDALQVSTLARADGFDVQPEHVFYSHSCDPCCGAPHPFFTFDAVLANPMGGNPMGGNPMGGNPMGGNPMGGNPMGGNPMGGNPFVVNPMGGNESRTSSARPALDREFPVRQLTGPGRQPRIAILDTGLAQANQLPALISDSKRIMGPSDTPSNVLAYAYGGNAPADQWLDPVAGHGTFIAGLIEQLAPGCAVRVAKVINPLGDTPEGDVISAILAEAALPAGQRPDVLSLSFGGTVIAQAPALASAVAAAQLAGIVVVASAGNNGANQPQYPAAYDDVIAVGALGPYGPTPWTNYGSWVDACAPGAGLVSSFFADFNGLNPEINTVDIDRFRGWARWSGTSFSAPVVVAALAREMVVGGCTAKVAVDRVVRAPHQLRIRCLGTVVTA